MIYHECHIADTTEQALRKASTKALVKELSRRSEVRTLYVGPDAKMNVAVTGPTTVLLADD